MNNTIYQFQYKKNHPKLSYICNYGIFPRGFKNEFETAVVIEPSVFESLKVYCMPIKLELVNKNDLQEALCSSQNYSFFPIAA